MKVLNFGSLNIDYVYQVKEFVQPGETISSLKRDIFCGGKGLNQSLALARAGVEVYHAGAVGSDDGIRLKKELEQGGVDVRFLEVRQDEPSGHTVIQVNERGENCIILFGGANQSITKEHIDSVFTLFTKGDILLLQNEINSNGYIMEKAHEKEMVVMLNPSPMNEKIEELPLQYVDYFLLNEVEAEAITKVKTDTQQLMELGKLFPKAKILLTLGSKGCMYQEGEMQLRQESFRVKAVDTTAAGDTFTGYFISGVVTGTDMKQVLSTAAKAAAIAVTRAGAGVSIPYMDEVLQSKSD